jgi:hypothetical protein
MNIEQAQTVSCIYSVSIWRAHKFDHVKSIVRRFEFGGVTIVSIDPANKLEARQVFLYIYFSDTI